MNRRQLFGFLGVAAAGSVAAAVPETRKPIAYQTSGVQCAACHSVLYLEADERGLAEVSARCRNSACPNHGIEVLVHPTPVYAK